MKSKQLILEELKALNIARCVIDYSGSGDSGQIDNVWLYRTNKPDSDCLSADRAEREVNPSNETILLKIRNRLLNESQESLKTRIENLAYEALEHVDASDWINNDGGGGVMFIYVEASEHQGDAVAAGTIKIDHYYNVQETENYEC